MRLRQISGELAWPEHQRQDWTTGTKAHNYTYSYDSVNNRLSSTETGAYLAWTFDAANRMLTAVGSAGTTSYSYSLEGTLASVNAIGVRYTFTQDVEYKLASQTSSAGTRSWYYDANSRMQYYTGPAPAGNVSFVWDFGGYLQILS